MGGGWRCAEHEEVWGAPDAALVGGVDSKLQFGDEAWPMDGVEGD